MDFVALKMTWDKQDTPQRLAIDPEALHTAMSRQADRIDRDLRAMHKALAISGSLLGLLFLTALVVDTWVRPGGTSYQNGMDLVLAGLCLSLGCFAWRGYRRQQTLNTAFDRSMLGVVERSETQAQAYITQARWVVRFHLLPLALIAGLDLIFVQQGTPWVWIATLLMCLFGIWETRRDLRDRVLPERKNLAYLREQLLAEPADTSTT